MPDSPLTKKQLVRIAAKHGYEVTPRQIQEWHRHGLLGSPTRKGLGRGRGIVAHYPPATKERLLALCGLRFDQGIRRHDYIVFHLWWEGFDVDRDRLVKALIPVAQKWDSIAEDMSRGLDDPSSRVIAMLDRSHRWDRNHSHDFLWGDIRRLDVPRLMAHAVKGAAGRYSEITDAEQEAAARAFAPLPVVALLPLLARFMAAVRPPAYSTVTTLEAQDYGSLIQQRDEVRAVLAKLKLAAERLFPEVLPAFERIATYRLITLFLIMKPLVREVLKFAIEMDDRQ